LKIENPFDSGHIKNYILAYVSVVVIMVLFFIAASLFREDKVYEKKKFDTSPTKKELKKEEVKKEKKFHNSHIKLLDKAY